MPRDLGEEQPIGYCRSMVEPIAKTELATPPEDERPLWDRDLTAEDLRRILGDRRDPRRPTLFAALLREVRPEQVWSYVTPQDVAEALPEILPRLGQHREFWQWLIDGWRRLGLLR